MTLRLRDLQSDSDQDSIRNSCDVCLTTHCALVASNRMQACYHFIFFHHQVHQYNDLRLGDSCVNGRFVKWPCCKFLKKSLFRNTLGENIADNGGIKAAYFGFFGDEDNGRLRGQVPRYSTQKNLTAQGSVARKAGEGSAKKFTSKRFSTQGRRSTRINWGTAIFCWLCSGKLIILMLKVIVPKFVKALFIGWWCVCIIFASTWQSDLI